jgi:F-type H+-transporting ATPase subunit b
MDKIGLNVASLVWQIVAFGLLVFLLWKFLYQPILAMLEERRRRIEQGMKDAQMAADKAAAAQAEFERQVAESKKEGQVILAQANEMSAKLREDILAAAREESRQMIEKAKAEIQAERKQAMADLERQVADLAITVSQTVIPASLDEAAQRRLISDFLSKTGGLK